MNNALAQAQRLWANLLALGAKRLTALAVIGLTVFAATGFSGYYLSRPTMETLYSGLDREDVDGDLWRMLSAKVQHASGGRGILTTVEEARTGDLPPDEFHVVGRIGGVRSRWRRLLIVPPEGSDARLSGFACLLEL